MCVKHFTVVEGTAIARDVPHFQPSQFLAYGDKSASAPREMVWKVESQAQIYVKGSKKEEFLVMHLKENCRSCDRTTSVGEELRRKGSPNRCVLAVSIRFGDNSVMVFEVGMCRLVVLEVSLDTKDKVR